MIKRHLVAGVSALAFIVFTGAAYAADPVDGVWLNQDKNAKIEIKSCGEFKCGTVVWLAEPNDPETGKPKVDKQNPDEAKRNDPILGLQVIWDMAPDGDGGYEDGKIYKASEGKVFKSKMARDGDNLNVKGCIAFLCQSQTWTPDKL